MKLSDLSIRRPVFAAMLIGALIVFGVVSYPRLGVDLFPNVEFPIITVTVVYPGADPETMESEVAQRIEEQINTLSGIKTLRSVNLEGATQVIVQFELEVKVDQAVQDIRDRVSSIQSQLPPQVEPPVIQKFDVGAAPVLGLALAGQLAPRDLTHLADKVVKERLQRVPGVGGVDLVGGRERQIKILVEPSKLAGVGLTVDDVAAAVQSQNLDMPGGSVPRGDRELTIKTKGQVQTAEDVGMLVIPNPAGSIVRIRDVARVEDTVADARSASYLNSTSAVALVIRKQSGSNTVEVARRVREVLAKLEPEIKQAGARLSVPTDNAVFIEHSIHDVQFDLLFGAFLATFIILLFLRDIRATLISAVAIPTSVIATFGFMWVMDFTFNNMTMLALSLSIGILIDDAIVVIENIHRHMHEYHRPPVRAASSATAEIFLAVLAVTSSIIAVFVPVALMKGIVGRFFFQFGLTVSFAVATSMLVSFTLTPMLSSRFLALPAERSRFFVFRGMQWLLDRVERGYVGLLARALSHRFLTLAIAVAALIGSFVLVSRVKAEFIPPEDRGEFSINVELPADASLQASRRVVEALAADIRKYAPGVRETFATIGEGQQGQINLGRIQVVLTPSKERSFHQNDLMAWVRVRYASIQGIKLTVTPISPVGGGGGFRQQPVQFNVRGDSMDELVTAVEALKKELSGVKGLVDLDTTYRGGKPEVRVEVDRERAADLGVPVATIGRTIRSLVAEDAVGELREGVDVYDITVQLAPALRDSIEALPGIQVRAVNGRLVDLSNVVKIERGAAATQIERQAGQRQITLLAGLEKELPLGEAIQKINAAAGKVVPKKLTTDFAGQGDIMIESFQYMFLALALAIVLVYMILAAQFDSFVQPVTIMLSLPFSVIGAFGGLFLSGMTLNIFSMIGIIMLMGLVTKNAILLVDFTIQRRAQGSPMHEALLQAGRIRLRPILMTTSAMVFGMLPVAMAFSEGGEVRAPMAVCVIGGLITSTLLTLVVVPVTYTFMDALTVSGPVRFLARKLMSAPPQEGSAPRPATAPEAE